MVLTPVGVRTFLPGSGPALACYAAVFSGDGVPDPNWGGIEGFEQVHRIIVDGCGRVLARALELDQAP